MPEPLLIVLIAAGAVELLMLAVWLRQLRTRNANLVDVCWALAVGGVSLAALGLGDGDAQRRLLVGCLIGWWSLRLGLYLLWTRVLQEREEDGRYQELRQAKGPGWARWSLGFFSLQALFVLLFAAPGLTLAWDGRPLGGVWDLVGIGIAVLSLLGEAVADAQLRRWRADPANKGRSCRAGLWRYSRHPNYFFEWLFWCGIACLATSSPWCWIAWAQATIALLLVLFVTGVPYTERQALRSRGEDYRAYQRTTPRFVPWFPRTDPAPEPVKELP